MSPKQTALIQTTKLFAIAITVGVLVNVAFAFLSVAQIGIGFSIVVLACLAKMVYDLEVAKAEHIQGLEKLKDIK
jgi:hypothetical protein